MPSLKDFPSGNEFPDGASHWPHDLDRRDFVKIMGASLGLAGLGGCARPAKDLVPYVAQPEEIIPGNVLFYATAMPVEGFGRGVLVETHEGRPTKIEGNLRHSESMGATDAITQASILSLYDPDRSQVPLLRGNPTSWAMFEGDWMERRRALLANGGTGFALLTEPTSSPSLLREIYRLLDRFPQARWYQHTPLARYDRDGVQPDYDVTQADVIVAIESDFLNCHPAALRYARAFAQRRRVENGKVRANRLYALEAGWSLTGAMADRRLPVSPAALRRVLNAVSAALANPSDKSVARLSPEERSFAESMVMDFRRHAPNVICIAGAEQATDIQQWAQAMNHRLGAAGRLAKFYDPVRSDASSRSAGDGGALADALARKEITTLAVLGANPVYTGAADLDFERKLASVDYTVHVGCHVDETAVACMWHLPDSHYLEAWGDLRGFDGGALLQQPLIDPLYHTRSVLEMVRLLVDGTAVSGYDIVRETWLNRTLEPNFEERWVQWLNVGLVEETDRNTDRNPLPPSTEFILGDIDNEAGESPTLILRPDPVLADGRWANNGWLQELPRPFTALVWDNALLAAPGFAAQHHLSNGDRVRIEGGGRSVIAPIWIVRGQAADCLILHFGGGRSKGGTWGTDRGVNAYRLRTQRNLWEIPEVSCLKTGDSVSLVSTQHHFTMEGRDLARIVALQALPAEPPQAEPPQSIYPTWPRNGHAWGMSIDLSTCIGCSACIVACQAENNIPVVGKEQVSRGREMHWIRVDSYIVGDDEQDLRVVHQPVPCMHCENAPCELVCPVAATVHDTEGLNEMIYNRCIGTRYCSNNCPYKVRRFNFFDFRAPSESSLHLQDNPNVTVRARGVMEKCTYCIQRVNAGRIAAEREGRPLRDGEVRTACQQVCSVEAIVFGDIADPQSAVSRRKREKLDYGLLAELNTRPRTTYLAKVINPVPSRPADSA